MSEIGIPERERRRDPGERRLFPMKVGSAWVYVEQIGEGAPVEAGDEIYAVSAPSPEEAFQTASDLIRELVHVVGERITQVAEAARPAEISVEFSLTFEAKGKASFIPILVSAEAGATTGLKISAVWRKDAAKHE